MSEGEKHRAHAGLARWAPALLVVALTLFHAINNWIWLNRNLVTNGWDRIGSLVNSLFYHQTLSEFSLQALFSATIQDAYRPPLVGLSMATMYKLFGVSADVAVMANMVYMLLLLAASYGIGARLAGRWLGMLSAVLVSLIPLVFAMSRYSYFEFALTALAALSVYFLLASERFERKGASVALGVALGLGALTKRTFPVFVAAAVVVVFFQAGLPRKLWNRLKAGLRLRSAPHPRWRDLGIALAGGLLLAALWYLPNREAASGLSAGFWLFPLWWMVVAWAIFALLQPSSPETNLIASVAVALTIASLWYLPHGFEFVKQILWLAWGIEDPRGRTVDFGSLSTYTDYLGSLLYGFSPVFVLVLVVTLGLLLVYAVRHRRRLLPVPWWDWAWWPIVGTLFVSYAILSTSIYKEDRAITPALPFLGIILAAALLKLPWRRLRAALIGLTVGFGVVQFFAISYTGPHQLLVETTYLKKPILGQWSAFAQGLYLETPDSGLNDPGFWIAEDVLQQVEATRRQEGWDTASLGIIAYSSHVHVGMFAYDQIRLYPEIQLEDPAEAYPQDSAYSTAFRYDYVLVLKNKNRRPAVREAENLILEERRSLFAQGFEEVKRYPLPDGSEAYLFRRRYRPATAHDPTPLYEAAEALHQSAAEGDAIGVDPPGLLTELLAYYAGPAPAAPLSQVGDVGPLARLYVLVDEGARGELEGRLSGLGSVIDERRFGALTLLTVEPPGP